MMTSSNGNIFRVTGPLCGEFTGPGEFPTQRPVTRGFDVFFDLRPNKRLSKQSWGWWFETPLWSLWSHCNVLDKYVFVIGTSKRSIAMLSIPLLPSYYSCNALIFPVDKRTQYVYISLARVLNVIPGKPIITYVSCFCHHNVCNETLSPRLTENITSH